MEPTNCAAAAAESLILSDAELVAASGGYRRPAEQLRALHHRGFSRAFRSNISGRVILERAHFNAVATGQYGVQRPEPPPQLRIPVPPNRAGYVAKFGSKRAAGKVPTL